MKGENKSQGKAPLPQALMYKSLHSLIFQSFELFIILNPLHLSLKKCSLCFELPIEKN
jgi:hypothetical protein